VIKSIKIGGFRSILDLELDLGLLNVFVGANGSGKSNILEAIGMLSAAAFGSVEIETLRYRGVRTGLPITLRSSFKGKKYRKAISLSRKN